MGHSTKQSPWHSLADRWSRAVRASSVWLSGQNIIYPTFREYSAAFHSYGYRQLNPLAGRWVSRDPIEEAGGVNLYGFLGNDGVGRWDRWGLEWETNLDYFEKTHTGPVDDAQISHFPPHVRDAIIIKYGYKHSPRAELIGGISVESATELECCTKDLVAKGRLALLEYGRQLKQKMNLAGLKPKPPWKFWSTPDEISCHNVSKLVAQDLNTHRPKCWSCTTESGRLIKGLDLDHEWAVCYGFDEDGKIADSIVIDLWNMDFTGKHAYVPQANYPVFPHKGTGVILYPGTYGATGGDPFGDWISTKPWME
jgi:RHS repeat-associated protein